jgi:hypothetical protein
MAIWLALIALLVVIFVALFLGKKPVEGFGEFKTIQKGFADKQRVYFMDTAAKGILTNPGIRLDGINEAAAQPDYDLPVNKIQDLTGFFMEDPENAWSDKDNSMCRGARHPRDLPPLGPRDAVGCGWWYFEDPETPSMGAVGSAAGPALPDKLPRGGTWIWSRAEASKLEDIKKCKAVKSCEFVGLDDVAGECAFCSEKGHGVPVTSNGALKYPDEPAASCGSDLIRDPAQCSVPEEDELAPTCGKGGRPSPDGSKRLYTAAECAAIGGTHLPGDICVRPDDGGNFSTECAGLNIPRGVGAVSCPLNGEIEKDCVLQLAAKNGFSYRGGLVNLIRNGAMPTMMTDAMKTLRENGINIPENLWRGGAEAAASNTIFRTIANAARRQDSGSIRGAAQYLIDGTPFNPCASYSENQVGPFASECVERAFRKAGCQAGGDYIKSRRAVTETANLTWSQANAKFKQMYNDMKSTDPRTQDMALKNCLGAGSEFHREKGETCWKCADDINTPIRRNKAGDIECASFNGRDCLWQRSKDDCERVLATLNSSSTNPLTCGEPHRRLYGGTGYDFSGHWCSIASRSGSHDGPLVVDNWIETAKLGKWIQIPGWLETIAIGDDNSLWGANSSRSIFFGEQPSASNPGWRQLPGLALMIDGKSRNLATVVGTNRMGLNSYGIYRWTGSNWHDYRGAAGTWISIGSDGVVYHANSVGDLYVDEGRGWQYVRGNVAQVSVGNKDNVWIVEQSGRVLRKSGATFVTVPGQLSRVAVSGDGSKVVGVNGNDDIFVWDGKAWVQIPGKLRNISVNNNFIVGTNSRGNIYFLKHRATA